jgi:hypothetical protein
LKLNIGKTTDGKAFTLPLDLVTQTQAIIATKGKGKTYLAMVQVEEMLKAGLPVVCLDPTGVWWGLQAEGIAKGFPIIVMGGEHGNVPLEPNAGEIIADWIVETNQSAVLDLSSFESNAAQDRFVTAFAERFYRRKAKNRTAIHLMLDEADSYCPQRPMPGQQRMLGAFEAIVRRGRSRGIGITLITQRPAVLNKNVLMMAELLTCLGIVGHIDQDAVDEWVKRYGDPEQRKVFMATLAALPKGRAWFWSPSWLGCFTQVDVRQKLTFDSSKTPEAGQKFETPKNVAAPDLASLTAQIQATIEKAKADDPKELRRKIGELEKKLRAAEQSVKPCSHEAEILKLKADNQLKAKVLSTMHAFKRSVDRRIVAMQQSLTDLQQTIDNQLAGHFMVEAERIQPAVPIHNSLKNRPETKQVPRHVKISERGSGDITNSQRKILNALAALERLGVTLASRDQIAILAGYASDGGAYGNLLGSLRTVGMIEYPTQGSVSITDAGRSNSNADDCVPYGADLVESWCSRIGGSHAKLLRVLVGRYPKDMTRDELAEVVGQEAKGGAFGNKLGRLRTLCLIDYPSKGDYIPKKPIDKGVRGDVC